MMYCDEEKCKNNTKVSTRNHNLIEVTVAFYLYLLSTMQIETLSSLQKECSLVILHAIPSTQAICSTF